MTLTLARRSTAKYLFFGLAGIIALHIFGRTRAWEHEWMWAFYQFNFVTVMIGPVFAGIAAWDAQKYMKARWLVDGSNRRFAPIAHVWAAVMVWVVATYLVGISLVIFLVRLSGTPGFPGFAEWGVLLPALALLAAEAAFGVVIGWYVASPLVSPAVTVGVFVASLFLYTQGPTQLITVGGATASMFGLIPRPSLQISQTIGFLTVATGCLAVGAWGRGGRGRQRLGLASTGAVLGFGGVVLIVAQGPQLLAERDESVVCFGESPEVCAGAGYAAAIEPAQEALKPYVDQFEAAGVAAPARFEQGIAPGAIATGPLSSSFLEGRLADAPVLVVNAYLSKTCDFEARPELLETVGYLQVWLERQVSGDASWDQELPDELAASSTAEQASWVRSAIEDVKDCR